MAEGNERDASLYGPEYLERLRRMMLFFRELMDNSGYRREEISRLTSEYALAHGYGAGLGEYFVNRLAGQMQWYGTRSFDVSHYKMDFVLRALGSSQADLDRAISGPPAAEASQEESEVRLVVSTFQRIRDPHLRRWVIADLMRTADLDANIARGASAPLLGPPLTPLTSGTPLPTEARETLEQMYARIEEALRVDEAERPKRVKPPEGSTGEGASS